MQINSIALYFFQETGIMTSNKSTLSDAVWYVYMLYTKGTYKTFKEALRSYDRATQDPLNFISPSVMEIEGMEMIRKYLNE